MLDKKVTCGFTGYRPEKYPKWKQDESHVKKDLSNSIITAINAGYKNFISGGSRGFDIFAAEVVIELKEKYDINLILAIPNDNQARFWSDSCKNRYNNIIKEARFIFKANPSKYEYTERNKFIVDNSNMLICFYDGIKGGTAYTYNYARSKKLDIINLAENQLRF